MSCRSCVPGNRLRMNRRAPSAPGIASQRPCTKALAGVCGASGAGGWYAHHRRRRHIRQPCSRCSRRRKGNRFGYPRLIEGDPASARLIARAIHGSGARRAKPFVAVNCGALPENLVESILFGHEKGAFTGATEKHVGKFAEADGGTLFLDEVGELPGPAQVKLLRALQEGEVEPVGGRKPVKVDVRIVSATNRDLIADVKAGRFREDLFYRLHVFPISVPALRTRRDDIPELARHFLTRIAAEEGKRVRHQRASNGIAWRLPLAGAMCDSLKRGIPRSCSRTEMRSGSTSSPRLLRRFRRTPSPSIP